MDNDIRRCVRRLQKHSSGSKYNTMRKSLKRQLTKSLRNHREHWRVDKCKEMEKAATIGNSRNLGCPIRSIGPRKLSISEVIKESDGTVIHIQQRRLDRWAE